MGAARLELAGEPGGDVGGRVCRLSVAEVVGQRAEAGDLLTGHVAGVEHRHPGIGPFLGREPLELVERIRRLRATGRGAVEDEPVDQLGMANGEVLGDHPAEGGADDVASIPPERGA